MDDLRRFSLFCVLAVGCGGAAEGSETGGVTGTGMAGVTAGDETGGAATGAGSGTESGSAGTSTATTSPTGSTNTTTTDSSSTTGDPLPPADETVTQFAPYLQWQVVDSTYAGNPFDVVATVSFRHDASREEHVTEMFYDGSDTWKFRFTGTRTGRWNYTSSADDPDLDGLTGTIDVTPNPDPAVHGFMFGQGSQFVRQSGDGELTAFLPNTYMNYPDGVDHDTPFFGLYDADRVREYVDEAFANGCTGIFASYMGNHWFRYGSAASNNSTPTDADPETFRQLERMIVAAHGKGAYTKIWAWGDESRRWTPTQVGGINSAADRRLQRYIAARLGPLPGWAMGYGFDLHEWTTTAELQAWVDYMESHLGWPHLLGARGSHVSGTTYDSYASFGRPGEVTTTRHGPADFAEVAANIDGDAERPHWYTERHSYLRDDFNLNMTGTRRLLWWQAMAGGVGGWIGFYPFSMRPYPNPEQLRTHREFWTLRGRLVLGMDRAPELSTDADTRVLRNGDQLVFYRENASSIAMDLSSIGGSRRAVAVDTAGAYAELDLGALPQAQHTWNAPHASDWAIAVGEF